MPVTQGLNSRGDIVSYGLATASDGGSAVVELSCVMVSDGALGGTLETLAVLSCVMLNDGLLEGSLQALHRAQPSSYGGGVGGSGRRGLWAWPKPAPQPVPRAVQRRRAVQQVLLEIQHEAQRDRTRSYMRRMQDLEELNWLRHVLKGLDEPLVQVPPELEGPDVEASVRAYIAWLRVQRKAAAQQRAAAVGALPGAVEAQVESQASAPVPPQAPVQHVHYTQTIVVQSNRGPWLLLGLAGGLVLGGLFVWWLSQQKKRK